MRIVKKFVAYIPIPLLGLVLLANLGCNNTEAKQAAQQKALPVNIKSY